MLIVSVVLAVIQLAATVGVRWLGVAHMPRKALKIELALTWVVIATSVVVIALKVATLIDSRLPLSSLLSSGIVGALYVVILVLQWRIRRDIHRAPAWQAVPP